MPRTLVFQDNVNYQDWMDGSKLVLKRTDYGCAGCQKTINPNRELAYYNEPVEYVEPEYVPEFKFMAAVAEATKTRELSGRAVIDFPVNKTEIYSNYRRNSAELANIIGTIDSVKNDKDITVTSISIKGFASPEGTYAVNERLAKGRTEALRTYVQTLYKFPSGFIKTSYEPEDWEGLREYVANSRLASRYELLSIIDDPLLDPDAKDWRMKLRYPDDYKILLAEVYPGLRHSDYRIEYTIRTFSDPVEIREVLRTQPQKLSLNEIYLAAQGLEPGSDEYNEIFETAVRLFPSEPVANLNAANAAMQRGDLTGAERYLERAGDTPEAVYARGVMAALNKDYVKGLELMEKARRQGLDVGQEILDHLHEVAEYAD